MVLEVLGTAIRQEKEIKVVQIRKEEVKLTFFADDMILYTGNPKYATKKLVVFINEYKFYDQCQVAGYKINTHKSVAYIYMSFCLFLGRTHGIWRFSG